MFITATHARTMQHSTDQKTLTLTDETKQASKTRNTLKTIYLDIILHTQGITKYIVYIIFTANDELLWILVNKQFTMIHLLIIINNKNVWRQI